ncbi:hypothetical protein PA01_12770 [Azoarcus sp. PA01]|nr:hypothetical protein PA01_12770 [Azoarcus sp. PA01]
MPVTQSDIDALNAAIRQGERMVRFADGKTVEYRSVAELKIARDDALQQLATESGRVRPRITKLYHAGRGFD